MSAEIVWSVIRKNAAFTQKRAGVIFSTRSLNNVHSASLSQFGRRRAVDVVTKNGKPALLKIEDGKATIQHYRAKRSEKLLAGFRGDQKANVNRKYRRLAYVRAKTASAFKNKKSKNVKA